MTRRIPSNILNWPVKTLALGLCTAFVLSAEAQISVYVVEPAENEGALNFTWSETWGADLNIAANSVEAPVVLVDDGTEADSLACEPLVNGAELAGNIALLYRGTCEFGAKALNAQNAGAVGVIIVNNIAGTPVGMGAGAVGDQVTIPVVMISDLDGANMRTWLNDGTVIVRIGTVTGLFPFNMGLLPARTLIPKAAAMPAALVQGADDFTSDLGAWVFNFGNQTPANVRLNAVITQEGAEVYNETSDAVVVPPGDSLFVQLNSFSQPSYSGSYELTYTILSDDEDVFPSNDVFTTTFSISNVFSYAPLDDQGLPQVSTWIAPASVTTGWRSCVYFQHPNASRVAATGMWVNLYANADSVFAGNFITVQANMWNTPVTTPVQLPDGFDLSEETSGDYTLQEADRETNIFVPFVDPLPLADDAQYLFCLITTDARTYHGFNTSLIYEENTIQYNKPVWNLYSSQWYNLFTGFDHPPTIAIEMVDVNSIGIEENDKVEITPYPNPMQDVIRIPLSGMTGNAVLEIFDMAGAKVANQQVNVGAQEILTVNLEGISNGTYLFNMAFENGKRANFRVVVSR